MSCKMKREPLIYIPSAFVQGLRSVFITVGLGKSNTWSSDVFSPRSGIHFKASGESGR